MPANPFLTISEILGEPAKEMTNPANAGYQCPFIEGICTKVSHSLTGPYPVCSVFLRKKQLPICLCPNRFFEADIVHDVLNNCWTGPAPKNPRAVYEVHMEKFGKVDLVIADLENSFGPVRDFVSVEIQAVDITGTYLPAYESIVNHTPLSKAPTYGFNWANVRKRFVSQLVAKGFYHHHWSTRIVAVLQADLFDQMQTYAKVPQVELEESNIVFMLYQFQWTGSKWRMELERVVPTTHVNVMNAAIYQRPPTRASFEERILKRLNHSLPIL